MNTRPNFILIMTDQQRGDCLGVDGHPCLLTPNMDALAGAGSRFRRAYTTCPSCIPARRSLLTGQFPATNGMPGFVSGVPITSPTLPGELSNAGYHTYMVGRTMHQSPPSARYGYDHVQLASGYEVDPYHDYLRATTDQVDGVGSHGLDFNGWNARPWHLDETLHPTHYIVNEALKFLENRDRTCPFFLTVSTYAPHPPLCPPAFYMDRYLRQDLPDPSIGDWAAPPANQERGLAVDSPRVQLEGEALRSCQAGYFGLINHLDDQIHRLLSPRGRVSYDRRNTVIIYTSDHGEMLGDHHMFRKCEPYEGSAHIPFIISGGQAAGLKSGQIFDQPVCLEDLMPTLLDLASIPVPEGIDGRSLAPTLRGEEDPGRPYLHGEHAPCYSQEQAHHYLVDATTKYIWRPLDGGEQLFDLAADPHECHNLAPEPAHQERLQTWRGRMIATLRDRPEGFTDGEKLIPGREYPGILPHVRRLEQS
jgi:arylsulfatase